jgi:hypothetical protein
MTKKSKLLPAQALRNRLEDEFNIILRVAPQRIWGEPSGSCRWNVTDSNGNEYLSYNTMSDCVKAKKLVRTAPTGASNKFFIHCEA